MDGGSTWRVYAAISKTLAAVFPSRLLTEGRAEEAAAAVVETASAGDDGAEGLGEPVVRRVLFNRAAVRGEPRGISARIFRRAPPLTRQLRSARACCFLRILEFTIFPDTLLCGAVDFN